MTQVMIDAMWEEYKQMVITFEEDEDRLRYAKLMFMGGAGKTMDAVTTLWSLPDQEEAKRLFEALREELIQYHNGPFPE
jgi:hypothetical protein